MMSTRSQRLRLQSFALFALAIFTHPATAQDGGFSSQQERLVAPSSTGTAQQGTSVATSPDGNTLVVGGVGDNGNVGAAWIFTRSSDGTWTFLQKLVGNDAVGTSRQGSSVAISADGNTIIVGAKDDTSYGVVRIFTRSGNVWTQQGPKLVGVDGWHPANYFWQGNSVAISADGNTVLFGGPGQAGSLGAAFVFTRTNGVWTQQHAGALRGSDAIGGTQQGFSVALSADGNTALVGAPTDNSSRGAAWVYTRSGSTWAQQGFKLNGSDAVAGSKQGTAVALSSDGNTALVGASADNNSTGAAWVFVRTGALWSQQGLKRTNMWGSSGDQLGSSVALSSDGNTALLGMPRYFNNTGAVSVHARASGSWSWTGQIGGSFVCGTAAVGWAVALSGDGNTAFLGGPGECGSVGAVFVLVARPTISNVTPASGPVAGGTSVTITGTRLTGTSAVTFGGTPATNFTIVDASTINATTPAHVFGGVDVTAQTPYGNATQSNAFTYTRISTTTSLVSTPNPVVFGQPVTFDSTVTGTTPTGTVTFNNGGAALCIAAVASGQAQCVSGALAVGSHNMTAAYSGDSTNAGSTSSIVGQVVNKANTTTVIGAHTPNPSTVGSPIAVSATLSVTAPGAGTPGGTIMISDGTASCVITLPATSCSLTPTSIGAKTLVATYGGSGNFNSSTSAGVSHTVDVNSTSTALGASANPSVSGQSVTFTATVTGLTPTGTITFNDGATALCSAVALNTGQAQCTSGALAVGSHNFTAAYSGDSRNAGSTSSIVAQVVNQANTTTLIGAHTPNPSTVGSPIAVSATVSVTAPGAGMPGGTITVSDGAASCVITLPAATCELTPTSLGEKTLTATYGGNGSFNGSTSAEPHSVQAKPEVVFANGFEL